MNAIIGLSIFIIISIIIVCINRLYNEMKFDPLGGETLYSPPKNEIPDSLDLEMIEEHFGSIERKSFSITGKALFLTSSTVEIVDVIDNKLIKPYPKYPTQTILLFEDREFIVRDGMIVDELGKHNFGTVPSQLNDTSK